MDFIFSIQHCGNLHFSLVFQTNQKRRQSMREMGNPDWASSIRRTFCSALCLAIYNHSKAIISCGHLCVVYTVCGENPLPQKDFAEKLYCLAPCSCGNCFFESSGQCGNTNRRLHNIGLRIAVFGSDCHSGKSSRKMRNHTDYLLSNACIGGLCRNCCVLHGNSERAFQHTFVDRDCLSGCY